MKKLVSSTGEAKVARIWNRSECRAYLLVCVSETSKPIGDLRLSPTAC
jgi:hypothetical protein